MSVIYSRNRSNLELSAEQLTSLAPAIFTEYRNPEVSDRYAPVSTLDAIEVLREWNYVPVQAQQVRSKNPLSQKYGQHLVAFSHVGDLLRKDRPEIILYNSHNAKSSVKLFAGFFRAICSNGLIAGEGFENRMVHYNSTVSIFEEMLGEVATKLPELHETIDLMKTTNLHGDVVWQMARQAASLRWEPRPAFQDFSTGLSGSYFTDRTISALTRAYRSEDAQQTLWAVYNRIQENLIRGGASIVSFTEKHPEGYVRRSKAIRSVDDNLRINRSLWDIATSSKEALA